MKNLFLQKKQIMTIDKKSRTLIFPKLGKFSLALFGLLLIISGFRAFELFGYIFKANVTKDFVLFVPEEATFTDVENLLKKNEVLANYKAFRWVSKKKEYNTNIKPGRYELKKGWNTNVVVNKLRNGIQDPLNATFNNVRTFKDLAGKITAYISADSSSLLTEFLRPDNYSDKGFSIETAKCMYIPNTYQLYWTTSPKQFVERMHNEYKRFWTDERIEKANQINMTPIEVSILASIVQEETSKNDEKKKVAGLYLNRLKRGMLLQADPTVKYAHNDFAIRRITLQMLAIDSPYNTYKYQGLPPGPITFPDIISIDAVLHAENHNYLFMCAKEDFSGYHNFATTLSQHNQNAARYHRALNQMNIWK
jgi:UPF0755 protein